MIVMSNEMLRFIETKVEDCVSDCRDFLDDRNVVLLIDDDEFDFTSRDRKKLAR